MLQDVLFYFSALICLLSSDGLMYHQPRPYYSTRTLRAMNHILHMKLEYRNAQAQDVEGMATLCADIFDGPFPWHQPMARSKSIQEYKTQFSDRLLRLVDGGIKHAMIVAVTEESNIIGFLEVGMLPCPIESNVVHEQPIGNTMASSLLTSTSESIWEDVAKTQSPSRNSRIDVPYLGNVAVSETYRRQGVGQKLVRIGMKIAQKWKENDVW